MLPSLEEITLLIAVVIAFTWLPIVLLAMISAAVCVEA